MQETRNVLLVDDEEVFLQSLVAGLRREPRLASVRFVVAHDGKEAREHLDAHEFDLVVTDLNMPGMDGLALLEHLASTHAHVPVVVMTAYGTPHIEQRAHRAGAVHYIEKPIDVPAFVNLLVEQLDASLRGALAGIALPDFLQLVAAGRKSCALEVSAGERMGILYFWQGELVDAECGDGTRGTEAALSIVTWPTPRVSVTGNVRRRENQVDLPLEEVLLQAAYLQDERVRRASQELLLPREGETEGEATRGDVPMDARAPELPGWDALRTRLDDTAGVEAAVVLSTEGEVLAHWGRGDTASIEPSTEALCALWRAADEVCDRIGFDGHDHVFLEGPDGRLFLAVDPQGRAWGVWGSKRLQLGMLRMLVQEVLKLSSSD